MVIKQVGMNHVENTKNKIQALLLAQLQIGISILEFEFPSRNNVPLGVSEPAH